MANRLDLTLRINAEDHTGPGRTGLQSIEQQLTRLRQTAGAFLTLKVGEIFTGQIGELIKTADAYKTLEGRLKLVSDNTSEYNKAQTELFAIAQRTRGDLVATYNVYGKLESAIKLLGGTQQQALTTTETLNQAIALTSQGAAQDAAAILQFSQALGSGVLRGDEFNSVMENAPGLAQALADGLDVPITKLRGMAEAGQLTADKLINALGKSSDDVAAKFAKIPLTVGGATTQLNNAFTQFVGLADKSSGASATLAGGISTLAKNLNTVADVGLIAAEVYGAKLVLGLSRSTQSLIEGAMAARTRAAADETAQQAALALLRVETQTAQIRITTTRGLIEEARLQMGLATTERERALATQQMTRAMTAYHAADNTARANQTALTAALIGTTTAVTRSERAFAALNGAMQLAFAFQIGTQVGEWLNQFEKVRQAGSYVAEAFVLVQSGAEAMLNGMSFTERWAQIKQIHAEFDQVRANSTNAAVQSATQVTASEETKTKAIEDAALKQQVSFKAVQDAVKALTASIDAESKQQTVLIEQSLTDRMAAIDAMDVTETQKDTLRVTAKLASYQQLAQLQQQASTEKLALIDSEYAKELTQATANAQRTAELETQKRQAKLAVYSGLADYYQGEIAKLSQVYGEENAAFAKSREDLQALARTHDQALRAIDQEGKTEHEKISQDQNDFDAKLSAIAAERKKGEKADQQKINELTIDAKTLSADLTKTNVEGGVSQYKAKENLNRLYEVEKQALIDNGVEHGKNALTVKSALDSTTSELTNINAKIAEMTAALSKEYLLKVGFDDSSINAAQAAIAELTKPETKVITIVTKNVNGGSGSGSNNVILEPGFARGGYPRRSGMLPGFGGGDKVKALLEAGEFIVRKEAVQALGTPVLQNYINAGKLPAGEVIKRAMGGPVRRYAGGGYTTSWDEETKYYIDIIQNSGLEARKRLEKHYATDFSGIFYHDGIAGDKKIIAMGKEYEAAPKAEAASAAFAAASSAAANAQKVAMPSVDLQQFASKAISNATAQIPSSKLLQAAQPPAGKTVNVQFSAPGAEAVAGQFNETDMDKLFRVLKATGLRSSGGQF